MPPAAQIAAASLLAFIAAPAIAATSASLTFDCDTADGHSSNIAIGTGGALRATTRIASTTLRPGKVLPNAGILVGAVDGKNAIGVQLVLAKPDAKAFTLMLVGRSNGQPVQKALSEIPLASRLDVIITIDQAGKGAVQIGTVKTPLTFADLGPKRVTAFCGGGEFKFDPLEVLSN